MITWQGFTAGFITALVMVMMVSFVLWIAYSRDSTDAMETEDGDWPHVSGR